MNEKEMAKAVDEFNKVMTSKEFGDLIEKGLTTVRESKGINDEEMNAVYSVAHNFYMTGRYDDAETIFKFLVIFDHLNPKYWIGLGAVRQVQKRFKEAIEAYANVVVNLDIENVKASYYAAECYLALGDRENAKSAIEHVKHFADMKTELGRKYAAKAAKLEKLVG